MVARIRKIAVEVVSGLILAILWYIQKLGKFDDGPNWKVKEWSQRGHQGFTLRKWKNRILVSFDE